MDIDTTKPNSARIYDYLLGGKHNYPVDRAAARRLLEVAPDSRQGVYLYRYFLLEAVKRLAKEHFTCYLDLASGIPTEGYIHERVPETSKIIYNDIDPGTVAYAREIVADKPNIRCVQGDLREIDALLAQAEDFFGAERRIGICMVGVAYFIEDAALAHVFQRLYAWSAPGSMLALNHIPPYDPEKSRSHGFYRSIGTTLYGRTPDDLVRLAAPWQVAQELISIESYAERNLPDFEVLPTEELRGNMGYGGILVHP